ncbi:MAG: hypothetical protein IPK64_10425 [bacterium]|nr:hypothetical protein [bacterium]
MDAAPPITCTGLEPALADLIADAARQAVAAVGLAGLLGRLEICADDLPGAAEAWLALRREQDDGAPALVLYCHPEAFVAQRVATATVFPPRAVWDRPDPAGAGPPLTAAALSRARTDAYLHHHLQWAADAVSGVLRPDQVPASLTEAFTACWAVHVDGRLARRELPGYPLGERRGLFSRLFSTGGILMPDHWKSFQDLWDGQFERPREVVAVARRLPHL